MNRLKSKALIPIVVLVILLGIGAIVLSRNNESTSEQPAKAIEPPPSQSNNQTQEATPVQPNINTQEFKLTSSNVSCSTSTINGETSRICSGNIRVIPRAQSDMEPGLYKINEQTKLLRDDTEQDLNSLQQLSQEQIFVRLTLADGSEDTLKEIRY